MFSCKISDVSEANALPENLAARWCSLYQQAAECTPFLNWHWIEAWLAQRQSPLRLVEIYWQEDLCAIGLFAKRVTRNKFGVRRIQWWLHRWGEQQPDQVWIEYNDFVIAHAQPENVRNFIWQTLIRQLKRDESYCLGVSLDSQLPHGPVSQVITHTSWQAPGFKQALAELPLNDDCWHLQGYPQLSKNTRQQVSKALRKLTAMGELSISEVTDAQKTDVFLEHFSQRHIEKWGASSGFHNPEFVTFHQRLLSRPEVTKILKITVATKTVAWFYYLVDGQRALFYMSALAPQSDNKLKLGLAGHILAMQYFKKMDYQHYDFLAGDARYKHSLTNQQYQMRIQQFYPSTLINRLEQVLRKIKKTINTSVNV